MKFCQFWRFIRWDGKAVHETFYPLSCRAAKCTTRWWRGGKIASICCAQRCKWDWMESLLICVMIFFFVLTHLTHFIVWWERFVPKTRKFTPVLHPSICCVVQWCKWGRMENFLIHDVVLMALKRLWFECSVPKTSFCCKMLKYDYAKYINYI